MSPKTPLESIFFTALEKQSAAERQAYLDETCAGNAELRAGVERMLAAQANLGSFLEHSPLTKPQSDPPAPERLGTSIDRYKLLQKLGEGGMGTVYMAEQTEPVQRRVALKVIKPGMDSRQVIARFEAERQALAVLDHANIARVLDAGATPDGRPYFVMELVHGVSITQHCDDHQFTPRERLELFVPVCRAIQHAHQKGIIHRDIKPSNVMVTLYDGRPAAKVIDFGVAKAVDRQLTERTLFTEYGTMVGTLEYMSPEQAEMNALGVDTRGDIYSLGVLLFELLTGSTPLVHQRVKQTAFAEILRLIKEEDPPKPSSRLDASGESLAAISARRRTEPIRLTRQVRGELDWIVLKCLEKDRNRRYDTAGSFAADIERYLNDEPVQACPPSASYRFSKFARRNKAVLATASGLAAAALFAVVTLITSNVLIRQEQARTQGEKDRAEKALTLAEQSADENRQGLERLKLANAWLERGRWYPGLRHWDDANAAMTKAIELRPDHVGAWVERGELFALVGLWDLAGQDFSHSFELQEADTTARWFRHALLQLYLGDIEGYRAITRRMLDRFHGTLSLHFALEMVRTSALDSEPKNGFVPLAEVARNLGARRSPHWYDNYVSGLAMFRAGRDKQAVELLRKSLTAFPLDWTGRALSYPVLAMALHRQGNANEARQALQSATDALDGWTRTRYDGEPTSWVIDHGASAAWPIAWWDWVEFQIYYREAKRRIEGAAPVDDPRWQVLRARSFAGLRQNSQADVEYARALALLPDDRLVRMEAHRCAAFTATGGGRWSRAAEEFARAIELSPDDSELQKFQALAQLAAGDETGYRRSCQTLFARYEHSTDPSLADAVVFTCVVRRDSLPDMDGLLPLARIASVLYGEGAYVLGATLYRSGKYEETIECLEQARNSHSPRAWEWTFLAMAHHRLGHVDEAARCLEGASGWIDAANRQTEEDLSETRPAWGRWYEPVVYAALLDEAQAIIGAPP